MGSNPIGALPKAVHVVHLGFFFSVVSSNGFTFKVYVVDATSAVVVYRPEFANFPLNDCG